MATDLTTVNGQRPDAQIKRDQWGRYRIPHPETGKVQSWTRATTIASSISDRFALEKWAKRNVALGLAARPDLYAKAATLKPDQKAELDQLCDEAQEVAAASAGSNLGTALHRFTEQVDRGEDPHVPPPWDRDVAAYRQAMANHGLVVWSDWIERVLVVPELDVAGTCDRLLGGDGWPASKIADLKTGKDVVRFGMTEIAIQLAIYAHATHWYDPATNTCHEIKGPIDQRHAIVMHLPVGKAECTIYQVEIAAGWDAVQLAMDVRRWRQRKDLADLLVPRQIAPGPQGVVDDDDDGVPTCGRCGNSMEMCEGGCWDVEGYDPIPQAAFIWLHSRVEEIKAAGYGPLLAAEWSKQPEIPTFPKGGPKNKHEFDQIDAMCDRVEAQTDMPFGPTNPTTPTPTKATITSQRNKP